MACYKNRKTMDIYVGNLPYQTTEAELEALFAEHGAVSKVKIVVDFATNRSKGFGFVTMDDPAQRQAAVNALNGFQLGGRPLKVNEAQPREDRPPRQFDGPRPPRAGEGRRDFGGKGGDRRGDGGGRGDFGGRGGNFRRDKF